MVPPHGSERAGQCSRPSIPTSASSTPPTRRTSSDQMPLDMQAGNAADVFQGCCGFFPAWAQDGYVLDISKYVRDGPGQGNRGRLGPSAVQGFLRQPADANSGVPKYQGTLVLYYNKDIFDKYKVAYPDASWTHEDYLAAMKRLTRDTNGDGSDRHLGQHDRHRLGPPAGTCQCLGRPHRGSPRPDEMRHRQTRRPWRPLSGCGRGCGTTRSWRRSRMSTTWGPQAAFSEGKLAMVEDGSWALKSILENADFRIGVAPIPAGPAGRVTLSTTDGFGIYSGTRHPREAWELVKFLVSKEYGLAMAEANLLQPARLSLVARLARAREAAVPEEGPGDGPRRVRRAAPRGLLGRPGVVPQEHGGGDAPPRRCLHEDLHPRSGERRHPARREPADRGGSDERHQ